MKHRRQEKPTSTRHYKQKIENLKLDVIDLKDLYDNMLFDYREAIKLLDESSKYTKSTLKYESEQAVKKSTEYKVID